MPAKKAVNLSKLPFNELRDKVKELEGYKSLNRFEITEAVRQAEKCPSKCTDKDNPRQIKPEISTLKAKLAEAADKKTRHELRRAVSRLKRETRKYI